MASSADIRRYIENLRAERDAIALYGRLAEAEPNPALRSVYVKLIETEKKHSKFWEEKLVEAGVPVPAFRPTWRSRILGWLAGKFGTSLVLPTLASIETNAASGYTGQRDAEAEHMPADEKSHAKIFGYMAGTAQGIQGSDLARFEGRHRASGGNALRAAVLGANDGLVSVFCLVMGVAGAGVAPRTILLTGIAGLLAGALSMALGEWLSVQSSRELYGHQLEIEERELAEIPDEEKEELALIYQAKGLDEKAARELADRLISDPSTALETLAREELAIDPEGGGIHLFSPVHVRRRLSGCALSLLKRHGGNHRKRIGERGGAFRHRGGHHPHDRAQSALFRLPADALRACHRHDHLRRGPPHRRQHRGIGVSF